jgi:hypothetical protein
MELHRHQQEPLFSLGVAEEQNMFKQIQHARPQDEMVRRTSDHTCADTGPVVPTTDCRTDVVRNNRELIYISACIPILHSSTKVRHVEVPFMVYFPHYLMFPILVDDPESYQQQHEVIRESGRFLLLHWLKTS